MSNWMRTLEETTAGAGQQALRWKAADGELLVLPHGARVLGCDVPGADRNLLWHHPGMNDAATAKGQLQKAGGELGGDRLWIAPEVAYFWADLELARKAPFEHHTVPPEMDPGIWRIAERGEGHLRLEMRLALTDHRNGRRIELDLERAFAALDRPAGLDAELKVCSWLTFNTATVRGGDDGAVAGLWDLCQMPVGGALYCPVAVPPNGPPREYYEPLRPEDVSWDDAAVRFAATAAHRIKMGLPPEQTTGRMGYYRRLENGMASFIFRHFLPAPGGTYIDLPRHSDATSGGDCLQAFCGDDPMDGFCEMEHHEPALIAGTGPQRTSGTCITHAIVGPAESLTPVARRMLGGVNVT